MNDLRLLRKLAQQHHVHVSDSESGDPVIRGRNADLYFDEGALCVIALDSPITAVELRSLRAERLYTGSQWWDVFGVRRRDFVARGVPVEFWEAAVHIAGCVAKVQRPRPPKKHRRRARRTPLRESTMAAHVLGRCPVTPGLGSGHRGL